MAECMAQTYVGGPTPAPAAATVPVSTPAPAAVLPSADFPLILDGMSWSRMEREQPALARAILGLRWVADGVTGNENLAVLYLGHIGRADASLAERILTFPWLNDGATFDTSFFLNQFWKISEQDTSLAHRIVGLPWVADGLTDNEIVKLADVRRITLDGITGEEQRRIEQILSAPVARPTPPPVPVPHRRPCLGRLPRGPATGSLATWCRRSSTAPARQLSRPFWTGVRM